MAGLGHLRQIHRVKACSPGGDRLEHGRQHFLHGRQAVPLWELELVQQEEQKSKQQQSRGRDQNELALQPVFLEPEAPGGNILPGQKPQAAYHDQQHDGDVDDGVSGVAGQGGKRRLHTHQIEAGIAERGDGMEHRVPQAAPQAELRTKAKRQHQRAHALNGKGGLQNKARHADDAAHLGRGDGLLHDPPLLQADPLAGEDKDGNGHGDHAHAAHLNKNQNDQLPKLGPIGSGVMYHKPSHAGG